MREVGALMPEGARRRAQPQDAGWQPVALADIAVRGNQYAVVDRQVPSVTVMSSAFTRVWHHEQRGPGPGELREPTHVQFDPRGDTLWVLDQQRHTMIGFIASSGAFVREFSIPNNLASFDITPDGRFLASYMVLVATATGTVPLVSEISGAGDTVPLLAREASSLTPPEFVLPGPNWPRLKVVGDLIALIYPAAGVVSLYRLDNKVLQPVRQIASCMPPALATAYQVQRSSKTTSQTSVELVTDVARRGDTLLVVGSRRDAEGRYGVQRFSIASGDNLGSIAVAAGSITLPGEVRLRPGPGLSLVAMDPQAGFIANMGIRSVGR